MSEKPIKPLTTAKPKQALTFTDGLNFGMGFFVAGALFFICVLPISLGAIYLFLVSIGQTFGD
jgi:hypothetical protein